MHIHKLEGTKYAFHYTTQTPPSFLALSTNLQVAECLKVFDIINDLVHETVLLSHLRCESCARQYQLIPGATSEKIIKIEWVGLRGKSTGEPGVPANRFP